MLTVFHNSLLAAQVLIISCLTSHPTGAVGLRAVHETKLA